ncbi:general secretion pathway protein GspB [Photobacterium makurazakiensis]|uniref:general secretion pathway protein GspB n=1 Tax=Photobacterium makurazakiensis TaxID=2910234 RepID=UPI003D12134C
MSKLLSALAQSEPQQAVSKVANFGYSQRESKPVAKSWGIPLMLFAAPVIGLLSYNHWFAENFAEGRQTTPTTVMSAAPVTSAPDQVSSQGQTDSVNTINRASTSVSAIVGEDDKTLAYYPDGIRRLDYPVLYTEPMPRFQQSLRRTANETTRVSNETRQSPPQNNNRQSDSWDLNTLDYSELSPQIARQFRSAIEATGGGELLPQRLQDETEQPVSSQIEAMDFGELPASVQDRLPSLDFQAHIYSSSADSRWVKVNGSEAYEGDEIAPGVRLRRIEPRQVVLDFESYLIAMPALSEW